MAVPFFEEYARIRRTSAGIVAARNAAGILCALGSFVATGVGPRPRTEPTPQFLNSCGLHDPVAVRHAAGILCALGSPHCH